MKAAFITFALLAASSAAAVAVIATGALDGATNAARPGFTDPEQVSSEELRRRALDAVKEQKTTQNPEPAIITTSSQPAENAADALSEANTNKTNNLTAPLQNNTKINLTKDEIREIPEIRKRNDPYADPQAPTIQTDAQGKTIINTSPYKQ